MTSKPMSDGGKGSVRRNEDNDAYQRGWDSIFGKKKEKEQPMMNDDPQERSDEDNERSEFSEDGEWTCDVCGGPMYRQAHWGYAQCDDCGARQELIDDDYV